MKQKLPIALAYLAKGYSVIPVGMDKRPLISWKEFQTRRATVDELVLWWTTNPDAQIGIVTGEISNLTVVDIESDGDLNLFSDETYRVKTGGGGIHIYFKYEKEFKNAVRLFPSVDIRSEGGYVVAAGSSTSKGPYSELNTLEVTQMSSSTKTSLLGALKSPNLPWYASADTSYPKVSTEGLEYGGCSEGGRNDAMTKFAGSIHAKLHPSLWPTIGYSLFEQANLKNSPPLPPYELRLTWNSIGNIERKNNPAGRSYGAGQDSSPKTWGPAPVEKKIEATFVDSLAEEIKPEDDPKDTIHASEVAALQVIDSEHTYPVGMTVFDDALLGGFSAGEVIVVAGQSGHGKTSVIQDWSVSLATGGPDKKDKLPSLWFSYEVLARPLWQKFQLLGADVDTPIYMPRLTETGETGWVVEVIEQAIKKWGIKVVCIDHLGFLEAPKGHYSNAADSITHTVRALKKCAVKHGLIILMPVHMRKTNSKNPSLQDIKDSSGIGQEVDTVFFIGRVDDDQGLPTAQAKMWLVKNRKTGISASATFDYVFGRYYYNDEGSKNDTKDKGQLPTSSSQFKDDDDW